MRFIHFNQRTGITELITKPIILNGENQNETGDSIHLPLPILANRKIGLIEGNQTMPLLYQ